MIFEKAQLKKKLENITQLFVFQRLSCVIPLQDSLKKKLSFVINKKQEISLVLSKQRTSYFSVNNT